MWVDWNPTPRRQEHGPVGRRLPDQTAARIALRHPHVVTRLPLPVARRSAQLTVTAEVRNTTDRAVTRHRARRDRRDPRSRSRSRWARASTRRALHAASDAEVAERPKPAALVAVPHGRAEPLHAGPGGGGGRRPSPTGRTCASASSRSTSELTDKGHRLFTRQRPADPRPRRRLGLGHAAAPAERASGSRAEMRYVREMGLNTIRLGGQARERRVLRPRRPLRHPGHARLVLLRPVGEVGQVGRGGPPRWRPASLRDQTRRLRNHPSVLRLDERQRRPAARRRSRRPTSTCWSARSGP